MTHLNLRTIFIICSFGLIISALAACGPVETNQREKRKDPYSTSKNIPEKIHLIPDDYHLSHVGVLSDGNMYWIDVQLNYNEPTGDTRDFICLYVFSKDGDLVSKKITDLGFRSAPLATAPEVIRQNLNSLSNPTSRDIWVRPFSIESFGLTFGLVVRDEAQEPVVDAMPGWTIMFYAPWPDGGYDT